MSKANCSYCPRPKNKTLSSRQINELLDQKYSSVEYYDEEFSKYKKPSKREHNRKK